MKNSIEVENEKTDEEKILENIKIVTAGIIKDIGVDNAYSSWKNTEKGLNFIKENEKDFYLGIKLWLDLTQNQLIGTNDDIIQNEMAKSFNWLYNLLEIKNIMNQKE